MNKCIGMFNNKNRLLEVYDDKDFSETLVELTKKDDKYHIDYIKGEKNLIKEIINSENADINVIYDNQNIWSSFEEEDEILYLAKFLKDYRFKVSPNGINIDSIEIVNFSKEDERTVYVYEQLENPEIDDRIFDRLDTKLSVKEILQIADIMYINIDYVEEEM